MKKIALFLIAIAVIANSKSAFGQGMPETVIGAKGGLNLANIIGDETDNKWKAAGHVGIYSTVLFDYTWLAQVELFLSWQGHAPENSDPFVSSLNLLYLNLPIMARYNWGDFNLHAGGQFGFRLSAKSKYDDFEGNKQTLDQKDFIKGFDFGIPIGVGYEFWNQKLDATIRYIIPISNISKESSFTRRNNVFQLSIGIKLLRTTE